MKTGASSFASPAHRRRGGLLVTALLLCSIISMIVLPSYLLLSKSVLQMSHRGFYSVAVVDLSESGIEHAIWAQKLSFSDPATAWSGWSQNADGTYFRKLPNFSYGGGVVGTVNVAVTTPSGANPIALTKASITLQDGSRVEKWLRVTINRTAGTASPGGIWVSDTIIATGGGSNFDSWKSDHDDNPATAPVPYSPAIKRANTLIATTSKANGAISYRGQFYGNAKVGSATVAGIDFDWSPKPTTLTTNSTTPAPQPPTTPGPSTHLPNWVQNAVGSIGTDGATRVYDMDRLELGNGGQLTFRGNVTLILNATNQDALSVNGSSGIYLASGATVALYTAGNISIVGSNQVNNTIPRNLRIWGTAPNGTTQTIKVEGSTTLCAAIYAPNALMQLNGGGSTLTGSVLAKSFYALNGNFHADESLFNDNITAANASIQAYAELDTAVKRSTYSALLNF